MKINREELVIGYFATLVAGVFFALGPLGNDLTKEMALFFFKLSVILFVIFRVKKKNKKTKFYIPTMKTIRVVLDITYNDSLNRSSPAHWDWNDILDIGPDEEVKLVSPSTWSEPPEKMVVD